MEFFDAVRARRSIRRYTSREVPPEIIERALDAALLAPNSSNLQTWQFFWVRSPAQKARLVKACLSQSAARTAAELVVVVANPGLWKKTNPLMQRYAHEIGAPRLVRTYYDRLVPMTYGWLGAAPLKALVMVVAGFFRPIVRKPITFGDLQEVSIKSAALAAENFMLAITAQGFATCPMEGLDEWRVRRMLKLPWGARVVMAISIGEADAERGTWGPQVRFDRDWFVKEV
jgi:nitroreductase